MKTVRIANLLNMGTVNYGNRLQAYAIEKSICKLFPSYDVKTIILSSEPVSLIDKNSKAKTSIDVHKYVGTINNKMFLAMGGKKRLNSQNRFTMSNMNIEDGVFDLERLCSLSTDYLVVGSDVVWQQTESIIYPTRLLAIQKNNGKPMKISYAASLGRDFVPEQNKNYFINCIKDFDSISVREQSSVSFLNQFIENRIEHVVDPTMLISDEDWRKLEKPCNINDSYIFVYTLGSTKEQRNAIRHFANIHNLKIATVPCANGVVFNTDLAFGDYRVWTCEIEQWLWLIDHAQYVITDSFHGCVFSTLFHKKFVALSRDYSGTGNINNRINDFLSMANQIDKKIDIYGIERIDSMRWEYKETDYIVKENINQSLKYLSESLSR